MSDIPAKTGLGARNRERLAMLHRSLPGPFDADDAAKVLNVSHTEAARITGYLASHGWLSRIRRGLFTVVPLEAGAPESWRADPWLVAARVFAPCYVGGWSALEHWDLTEQLFRSVLVVTAKPQRSVHQAIQGMEFRVVSRKTDSLFGTRTVWRGRGKVEVSDPTKTVADVLDDPSLGGGIRNVAEILSEYFSGDYRDDQLLAGYADRIGNRAAFKRLGYLIEECEIEAPSLLEVCWARRSAGLAKLDPSIRARGRITKRWGLRINARVVSPTGA